MRARITLLLFAILYSFTCLAQTNFEKHFTKKSLRIDFALSGNWDFQAAAIQQLRRTCLGKAGQKLDRSVWLWRVLY